MRTKRQPTIRTWLLMVAVIAPLCASFQGLDRSKPGVEGAVWLGLACEIAFWTVLPLTIGLLCQSIRRVAASCFGFGCVWILVAWFVHPHLWTLWSDHIYKGTSIVTPTVLSGIVEGPFLWLMFFGRYRLFSLDVVLNTGWLLAYSLVGILFAKSCRLREQPAVDGTLAP
jgi:hypothetical protein